MSKNEADEAGIERVPPSEEVFNAAMRSMMRTYLRRSVDN
jgi:hypothetical protein